MLEMVIDPDANSRLACQIVLTAALDGLVVGVPAAQI
jgi:2Fe-2S ferredoxin